MQKDGYREELEALYERFGRNKALLSLPEVAEYLGVDRRSLTASKDFPLKRMGRSFKVSIVALARWLAA